MLTGLITTGSNVFQSDVYPLENDDLTAMCIYTQDEEIEVGAMGDPRVCHSIMTLIVDSCAQTSSNLVDQLDQAGLVQQPARRNHPSEHLLVDRRDKPGPVNPLFDLLCDFKTIDEL